MEAGNKSASIGIELAHPDPEMQELFFEQFLPFKTLLHGYVNEEWNWQLHATDDNGKVISQIFTAINNVSIYNKNDWPALISFFKPRIIALDEFWSDARYSFEGL